MSDPTPQDSIPVAPPLPEAVSREDERPRRIDEAVTINFIHEALRTSRTLDELLDAIVVMLLARDALGFSRALLLEWSETDQRFHGYGWFCAQDHEAHTAAQAKIENEFNNLMRHSGGAPCGPGTAGGASPPAVYSHTPQDVRDGSDWRRLRQDFQSPPEITRQVRRLRVDLPPSLKAETRDTVLDLFPANNCRLLTPAQLAEAKLPEALTKYFDGETLWIGIGTQSGPRLIIAADKFYENEPIREIDCLHLNWFAGQVALAMENLELIKNLRERNRELKDLDNLKSSFLATISHELRTPLTAITGFTRLVLEDRTGPISPAQRDVLGRVLNHADRLADVVNDLIEIVEIDAGSAFSFDLGEVDPLDALQEVLPKLEPRRSSKSVVLQPVVFGPVPNIVADGKGLKRIFYHLIDNAIKFSHEGGLVKIRFRDQEKDLAIEIRDYGIGIPEDKRQAIFESFYQVDGKLAREYEGMGIGLTLTRKLIDGAGGRLQVESTPNEGSRFTIIFPKAAES